MKIWQLLESIKLLEFNVVNQQEVDSYLDKIAAKTNIPEVKNWIKKNIRTYIINNQQLNKPTKVVIDTNTPNWLRDAVNRGDALYKFAPNNEFTGKLEHILDWLNSEQAKEYINKLQKVTFDQAVDLSDRWTKTLVKKASSKEDEAGIKDIMQLPNGFRIVQVISKQALDREGKLMQHCVGSYANEVAKGSTIIYSLRDSKNQPHCTIEVESNRVEQIKGKQNNAVVEKYVPYVKLFLDKIKLKINPRELNNAGLIEIDGKILKLKEINEFTEQEQIAAVKQNGLAIEYIKNPSEAVQLAAVKKDGFLIRNIKNPSEEVQLAAVKQNGLAIKYIKNPSEAVQIAAVQKDGRAIQFIENPSEAVQLFAVKQDGWTIEYIKNPSEAVQIDAVKQNGYIIKRIENPSLAVQLAAVKYDGFIIQFIRKPSEAVQLAAVKQVGWAIRHIENPSETVQLAAVKRNELVIEYFDNPSEEVQIAAVEQNGDLIEYLENPSETVQIAAVKRSGLAIQYIENPSLAVQLAAVKEIGYAIQYIKNPSEEVQLAAVEEDPEAIHYIKKPTPKVLAYVKSLKK